MHIVYDPQQENWSLFVNAQQGGGDILPGQHFAGIAYQRGGGVGDILRGLWRYLLPMRGIVGQEGLRAASNMLSDIVAGKDVSSSAKKATRTGLRNVLTKAANTLNPDEEKEIAGEGRRRRRRLAVLGGPSRRGRTIKRDIFAEQGI